MEVEGLGSGEYHLVKRIRELLGEEVIISIAYDAHANTEQKLPSRINVMRMNRTTQHHDQEVTEKVVARHMIDYIKNNKKITPQFVRLSYIIHPEKALSDRWPLSEIMEMLREIEKKEGIAVATLGVGMIWCDCKTLATNV